jgi:hypothetical protein
MKRLAFLPILSFFVLLILIPSAYAVGDSGVNVGTMPQDFGEKIGIPEPNTALVGGLILSIVVFMAIVLPSLLLGNKAVSLIFCFLALGLSTSLGWLPGWIMLMVALLIAGTSARQIMKWFR